MSIAKGRAMQVAHALNYAALLIVPYLIIGQDKAIKEVVHVVASHLQGTSEGCLCRVMTHLCRVTACQYDPTSGGHPTLRSSIQEANEGVGGYSSDR